jgi:hypothetical protein
VAIQTRVTRESEDYERAAHMNTGGQLQKAGGRRLGSGASFGNGMRWEWHEMKIALDT